MKTLCISLIIVALLILAVQIITEIIKSVFKDKENIIYNLIVFGVSLFLTLVTVIAASQIVPFKLVWYHCRRNCRLVLHCLWRYVRI